MHAKTTTTIEPRYALYFAPSGDSQWWHAWSSWLGRCAETDKPLVPPTIAGIDVTEFARLTSEPRRYGWHATLKAPFRLSRKFASTNDDREIPLIIEERLVELCSHHQRFAMPSLHVDRLGDFLALRPIEESNALRAVAGACVTEFDDLSAPLTEIELARRRLASLTLLEDELLVRWGYPYVFERFRFHLSLTGSLQHVSEATVAAIRNAAEHQLAELGDEALAFDAIALFREDAPGAPFRLVRRFPLAL